MAAWALDAGAGLAFDAALTGAAAGCEAATGAAAGAAGALFAPGAIVVDAPGVRFIAPCAGAPT